MTKGIESVISSPHQLKRSTVAAKFRYANDRGGVFSQNENAIQILDRKWATAKIKTNYEG